MTPQRALQGWDHAGALGIQGVTANQNRNSGESGDVDVFSRHWVLDG